MVAAPETVVNEVPESSGADAVDAAAEVDWQKFDEAKKLEYAESMYQDGRKFFAKSEYKQACDAVSTCLDVRTSMFGEKSKELYEPLILNARILLEQGRLDAGVISTAVQGLEDIPVEEDEESADEKKNDKIEGEELTEEQQDEVADKVEAALEENAERIENKQPLPTEEEVAKEEPEVDESVKSNGEEPENKEEEQAAEGEDEAEEGAENDEQNETDIDDLSPYQLAYENAATGRLIAENCVQEAAADSDDAKLWSERVCESLILLGEISIADDNYETAIDDLTTAESKQRAIFAADDRRIAETYFQMGRCYTQWNKYDKAAEVYKKSLEVISLLKDNTAKKAEAATADDEKGNLFAEVKKLGELVADVESWVKDSVDSHINKQQFDEEKAKENAENRPLETTAKADEPVQEISVRKRKPDEKENEKDEEKTVDEITAKKAKVAQDTAAKEPETA